MKRPNDKSNQSRRPRPILYVYKDPKEPHCYWFHGLTFLEFHTALQLHHPLIIFHNPYTLDLEEDPKSRLCYVPSDAINHLAQQDIYSACGDFIWVDTPTLSTLKTITPNDLAALLYMAHTFKPLKSPFLKSLKNRFAYLAHDDGWLLRLYTKNPADISTLLQSAIHQKSHQFLGFAPRTDHLTKQFLQWSKKGLTFDFRPNPDHPSSILIWQPGPLKDMDAMQQRITNTPPPPHALRLTQSLTP